MMSLNRRLVIRVAALYAVVLVLAMAGHLYTAWHSRDGDPPDPGHPAIRDLVRAARQPDGRLGAVPNPLPPPLDQLPGAAAALYDPATGQAAAGSDPALTAILAAAPWRRNRLMITGPDGEPAEIRLETIATAAGPWRVALRHTARPVGTLPWLLHELRDEILPLFLPLLLGTLVIGRLSIRGGLAPLRRVSAEVAAIQPGQPARLDEKAVPVEILPLAQAANRALDRLADALAQQRRFTATAAHELRTPLAVLRARIDSLAPGPERADLQRDAARMARLVDQLLAVARLEAHQVELDRPVDLAALARETLADLVPLALAGHHTLALEAPGDAPPERASPERTLMVRGDAAALAAALRNLVENALHASPPGGQVDITLAAGADQIRLAVCDRGPGVPPALRPVIFEPFRRGRPGGSGLGLAIVAETVALHGGTVSVADRPGGGAHFVMSLPCAGAGPLPGAGTVSRRSPPAPGRTADATPPDQPPPPAVAGHADSPG